jgi:hypothetical protein
MIPSPGRVSCLLHFNTVSGADGSCPIVPFEGEGEVPKVMRQGYSEGTSGKGFSGVSCCSTRAFRCHGSRVVVDTAGRQPLGHAFTATFPALCQVNSVAPHGTSLPQPLG